MKWKINLNEYVYIIAEKTPNGVTMNGYPNFIERLIISRVKDDMIYFALEDEIFACVNVNKNEVNYLRGPFTSTELRNVVEKYREHDSKNAIIAFDNNASAFRTEHRIPDYFLRTELHTHFLEMLTGREFLDLMSGFTKYIPTREGIIPGKLQKGEYLDQMPITDISVLRMLEDNNSDKSPYNFLCSQLSLDISGQVPFAQLEEVSTRRSNVITTAAKELAVSRGMDPFDFKQVAECRASIYAAMLMKSLESLRQHHIEYVEFSYSTKNTIVRMVDYIKQYPEEFSGIDFNILYSFSRNVKKASGVEKAMADLRDLITDKYVIGFDLMGQENGLTDNDTVDLVDPRTFISIMKRVLEIMDGREDLVLRLHAGENFNSRNNPLDSLRVLDAFFRAYKVCSTMPQIRIGHGLHFSTTYTPEEYDEYAELLRRYGVIVEINATSNFTLSNIEDLDKIPYRWYASHGIPMVLATDGAGMYLTDAIQEKIIASIFGGEDIIQDVASTEKAFLGR